MASWFELLYEAPHHGTSTLLSIYRHGIFFMARHVQQETTSRQTHDLCSIKSREIPDRRGHWITGASIPPCGPPLLRVPAYLLVAHRSHFLHEPVTGELVRILHQYSLRKLKSFVCRHTPLFCNFSDLSCFFLIWYGRGKHMFGVQNLITVYMFNDTAFVIGYVNLF